MNKIKELMDLDCNVIIECENKGKVYEMTNETTAIRKVNRRHADIIFFIKMS